MILLHLTFTNAEQFDYWNSWGPALGQCEIDLAIIAACIPTLKPVVAVWFPSIFISEPYQGSHENYFATTTFGGTGASASRPGHARIVPNAFVLSTMGHTHTTIRGHSPDGSEEEIMTSSGVMRKTQVNYGLQTCILCIREYSPVLCKLTCCRWRIALRIPSSTKASSLELYEA